MKSIYQFDESFIYVFGGDSEIPDDADVPQSYTDVQPPDGLFKGKYDPASNTWSESATQGYIDSLQPKPPPPSDIDLLKQQNADLLQLLAESEKRAEEQSKTTAELVMVLAEKGVI
ncbi:hypothetical protein [Bacillus stratosphericus]|uniref:hypothetical protein n=1 Tax=Bacillus stratosphericus TaxID=293386 RepID=UPI001CF937D4|nr:hypothetical protein [Bacillus stratosphericus]